MDNATLAELENLFLALSDRTRLRLLALMANGEVSVGFLADQLGESQPKTSRHLAYLRNAGLVSARRDGKWIYYNIKTPSEPTARRVLLATIDTIPEESASPRVATRTIMVQGDAYVPAGERDTYADTDTSPFEPNEMAVYLL